MGTNPPFALVEIGKEQLILFTKEEKEFIQNLSAAQEELLFHSGSSRTTCISFTDYLRNPFNMEEDAYGPFKLVTRCS